MTEAIQNHISSLNWGYRLTLREKGVAYVNAYGEFVELHKIKVLPGFSWFLVSHSVYLALGIPCCTVKTAAGVSHNTWPHICAFHTTAC